LSSANSSPNRATRSGPTSSRAKPFAESPPLGAPGMAVARSVRANAPSEPTPEREIRLAPCARRSLPVRRHRSRSYSFGVAWLMAAPGT
jgi:hypothetical protein